MSITYNDLISRAEQVRDESEIGANTATRVGQLLADIIQWCKDNNADLGDYLLNFTAHLNESGGILNWFQSRIVLLKTMGSAYDDVSVGSLSDGDVYYDSQGNWIREKQGSATINGIHPSKGVFYVNLANKTAYQWDGTTFQVAIESGGGGGASTVTAFEDYEVVETVANLPEQGNPTTGYIVGTHIYIYVGEGGDTADGKYQDLGELSVNPDIYQPRLTAGTGISINSNNQISVETGEVEANETKPVSGKDVKEAIDAVTPTIDQTTNNWVIGGVLTDRPSRGEKGNDAPVPYIGENGNWWVGGVDTEVPAQGPAGDINISEGTTPTLTIVQNLNTEDDAQDNIKVLSAGMGKKLGDAVFDGAVEEIDVTSHEPVTGLIDYSSGNWQNTDGYKSVFIPISGCGGWGYKIGNAYWPGSNYHFRRFAFLKNKQVSAGNPPSYCDGTSCTNVLGGSAQWSEGVIPNDANYLCIYVENTNGTFYPELYLTNPNPSSRIERLEDLTDGVSDIKEGWFAISGEDYDYSVPADDFWNQQNIDADNGTTLTGSANAGNQKTFPKSASISTAAASPTDCYKISDLPDRKLKLTFSQRTDFEAGANQSWLTAIALYDASLSFLSRTAYKTAALVTDQSSPDYGKLMCVHDFSGSTYSNAAYFKIILSRNVSASSWTFKAGDMSFVKRPVAQESMPDRVETLEEKVAELSGAGVSKFRICSWNVGHWCLGGNYKTDIDTQAKYEEMRGKWRTKLNEMSPDVIVMCEYSTVFAELGTNIEAKDAIFGQYAYRAIGSVPSATSWMQTAQYTNIPIRNTSEVVYAQTVQAGRYYQVSDLVLGGVTAKLVITHLDWGNSQNNGDACRAAQMQTLLDAFANESHVIICGDFNNPLSSEFDVFANAGYSMANHGYMGDLPTYPATKVENGETVPPDKAIDNILVKGFAVSKIEIVDDATLTDHCGIMCDLTLID